MNSERLKQLLEMASENPDDPFIFYAIALEYQKIDSEKSIKYFRKTLDNFPDYLPTYYTFATQLYEEEIYELAMEIVLKGIDLANTQKNLKAVEELMQLKLNIEFEL